MTPDNRALSVREEFEKAFIERFGPQVGGFHQAALFGLQYGLEFAAKISEATSSMLRGQCAEFHPWRVEVFGVVQAEKIRYLAAKHGWTK